MLYDSAKKEKDKRGGERGDRYNDRGGVRDRDRDSSTYRQPRDSYQHSKDGLSSGANRDQDWDRRPPPPSQTSYPQQINTPGSMLSLQDQLYVGGANLQQPFNFPLSTPGFNIPTLDPAGLNNINSAISILVRFQKKRLSISPVF